MTARNHRPTPSTDPTTGEKTDGTGRSRREVLRTGGLLAALGLGSSVASRARAEHIEDLESQAFPRFYPRPNFTPEIDLAGRFVVITGASRGIGLATGEALTALGATVIGTSRDAGTAPNPTSFPLLDLDIASPDSIAAFVQALTEHPSYPGHVDILINNAGRFVIGSVIPPGPGDDPLGFFADQVELGMETLYGGHVRLTNRILPLMPLSAESRILFTVSIAGYAVGGAPGAAGTGVNLFHAYYSGKRALLAYANCLRGNLAANGIPIQVATVNPFAISTDLIEGDRPIFTEPVDSDGNAPSNPELQGALDLFRTFIGGGLPPSLVADAFVQLCQMAEPAPNVVAASEEPALAAIGGNAFIRELGLQENEDSAVTYGAVPNCPAGGDDDNGRPIPVKPGGRNRASVRRRR